MRKEEIKKVVREGYAKLAKQERSCCSCEDSAVDIGKKIGYTEKELKGVPEGSGLGLGCGNPVALASLKKGDTVLDLGSGAGIDCFLAAKKVGAKGKVIGVDMTPEMIEKAKENAKKGHYRNVEFKLGEIEKLPIADDSVDVVISNCVINLSPEKGRAFAEAFRVLRPGGRLLVSDIVLLKELPKAIKDSIEAYIGCLSGAILRDEYFGAIKKAGFREVKVIDETSFPVEWAAEDPTAKAIINKLNIGSEQLKGAAGSVISIKISGVKPRPLS